MPLRLSYKWRRKYGADWSNNIDTSDGNDELKFKDFVCCDLYRIHSI